MRDREREQAPPQQHLVEYRPKAMRPARATRHRDYRASRGGLAAWRSAQLPRESRYAWRAPTPGPSHTARGSTAQTDAIFARAIARDQAACRSTVAVVASFAADGIDQ